MDSSFKAIAVEAGRLAGVLPRTLMESLGKAFLSSRGLDAAAAGREIVAGIAHPTHRDLVQKFLRDWQTTAAGVSAEAVAMAVLTATGCEAVYQGRQTVEPVWTGPGLGDLPFRRTQQALLQVIDAAADRLLVVSYAVYNIPRIRESLVRAAGRGVSITIVVETPDRLEGQNAYSTLQALGSEVAGKASVYYWPLENREKNSAGKPGILHVKCAACDGKMLFLSSANLTQYAFTVNMELGVLVTGGGLPAQVEQQFREMITRGILARP